ncbi:MAG: hypothetical protein KatS3mg110_0253 [Pirellulaceae bacterium]|nr:MAG: hypothetical protein KatS3mg110_0253 [Pirellulaceae bacterium]
MATLTHEMIRNVDEFIDTNHDRFSRLGDQLFEAFRYDPQKGRVATQIRNLQQIVCAATRFADIEDFVKNQMGKTGGDQWRQVGPHVLAHLDELRKQSQQVASTPEQAMAVRLRLARGWVRAVVSQYLYRVALDQLEPAS